jgi:transcriptional regulator with AAA-type ATPase domain
VDSTIATRARIEVRGGKLTVTKGSGSKKELDIGPETVVVGRNEACDLVLDDRKVSAVHMELVATERGVRLRDLGSRNGTFIGDTRVGEVFLTKHAYVALGDAMVEFSPSVPSEVEVPEAGGFGPLVGASAGMRTVFERLKKAAPTDLTVLVTGETGTGK